MNTVKTLLIVLFLAAPSAYAANEIEVGKCYPAYVFYYHIVKKFNKRLYEIRSLNVPPVYAQALLVTEGEIKNVGMLGGKVKIAGQKEIDLENGFTKKVYIFKGCKE